MMSAMVQPVGPGLRWVRAGLLAAVAMGSGVLAHASAGGLMPGRGSLIFLFLVCLVSAGSLLGRPASAVRVVVLVMTGQTFIHGCLTAMSGHKGDPPLTRAPVPHVPFPAVRMPAGDGRRVGSLYEQAYANQAGAARTQLTIPAPVQHLMADLTGPHALMALAHLGAAVLVGLWLARGEHALWVLLALATDRAVGLTPPRLLGCLRVAGVLSSLRAGLGVLRRRAPVAAAWRRPRTHRGLMLARAVVRRGPPALLAA